MKAAVVLFGLAAAALVAAAPGHADANSYLDYLASHRINTPPHSPPLLVMDGLRDCQMLHAGMTPEQIVQGTPSLQDVRGMIEAAQQELCPDTLR
jgi:Protein of unknown function (DUF732)